MGAVWRRIGHRGRFLFCLGLFDLFFGWYLAANGRLEHVPLIPERAWGWVWITAGILLIGGAFHRRDALFFATAISVKVVWALEYFRLETAGHVPGAWLRGCYWLALAGVIMVAAAWPEPAPIIASPLPDDAEARARNA